MVYDFDPSMYCKLIICVPNFEKLIEYKDDQSPVGSIISKEAGYDVHIEIQALIHTIDIDILELKLKNNQLEF